MSEKTKSTSLFDRLLDKGKEAIKAAQAPFIRGEMKDKLKSAFRNATMKSFEASRKLNDEYVKLAESDINKLIEYKETIRKCVQTQEHLKSIYKELFDQDMPDLSND